MKLEQLSTKAEEAEDPYSLSFPVLREVRNDRKTRSIMLYSPEPRERIVELIEGKGEGEGCGFSSLMSCH